MKPACHSFPSTTTDTRQTAKHQTNIDNTSQTHGKEYVSKLLAHKYLLEQTVAIILKNEDKYAECGYKILASTHVSAVPTVTVMNFQGLCA